MCKRGSSITDQSKEQVLRKLLLAHQTWYDVYENHEFEGRTFPGYAEFHTHGEKYFLAKRAKLWEVDSHEYLFFQTVDHLDKTDVDDWYTFMCEQGIKKVQPKPNHMSSAISLVLIASSISDEAVKAVRKARFRKNFKLGLEGWSDLQLAAVDLSSRRIVSNGAGKDMAKTLDANIKAIEKREAESA